MVVSLIFLLGSIFVGFVDAPYAQITFPPKLKIIFILYEWNQIYEITSNQP